MAFHDPGEPRDGGAFVADEIFVYRERAHDLGLPFARTVRDVRQRRIAPEAVRRGVVATGTDGLTYIAPPTDKLATTAEWLRCHPGARHRLVVTTPGAIRAALMAAGRLAFLAMAKGRLRAFDPGLSARTVASRGQVIAGILFLVLLGCAAVAAPWATMLAINLATAVFFFGLAVLRFIAAAHVGRRLNEPRFASPPGSNLPVYTVLVPLRNEAKVVRELVAALDLIDWPVDRLDIKLIVEEDDPATRRAVERLVDGPPYEIVVVPVAEPRTKPKALTFALLFARGSLVTIYDAEDRPHPAQLREAYATFLRSGPELACLQAPIVVDNPGASLIARLFAVEYSALFDGLLPALATLRLPLPLGGTSNHFRRHALEAVRAWDPYNVTEDADLGIRLARFGYRSATLTLPTYEQAPETIRVWFRQRTRWFKGWAQTWLVHMRRPGALLGTLGLRQFVAFNLVGIGMIISALIHPVYLLTLALLATDPLGFWRDGSFFVAAILGLNLFNLVAGYLAVAVLTSRTLRLRRRRADAVVLFALPLYWLMMSVACARSLWQLFRRPHFWEKTPHRPRRRTRSDTAADRGLSDRNPARA